MKKIGRLHVLTDTVLQTRFSHIELVRLAISGGADTIQFRQKSGTTREMIKTARALKDMCKESGVTFIVNDRLDVAMAVDADGVHLGQNDFPIPLAREILGKQCVIGGSAATIEEARKCLADGADYVGFGPVYTTASKEDAGPASGIGVLTEVVRTIPLPIIAIGGITPQNTPELIAAGAYGIAVISAVCCRKDPRRATEDLLRGLQALKAGGDVSEDD
jgi:thiamine-phosphate pyrophosphorylase